MNKIILSDGGRFIESLIINDIDITSLCITDYSVKYSKENYPILNLSIVLTEPLITEYKK